MCCFLDVGVHCIDQKSMRARACGGEGAEGLKAWVNCGKGVGWAGADAAGACVCVWWWCTKEASLEWISVLGRMLHLCV